MYTNNMRKQLCYAQVENERGTRITLYQNVQYRTHRKFHKSNLLSVLDFYATFGLRFSQNIKGYCFNIPAWNCACTHKIHVLVIYLMIGHLLWELHLPGIPYQTMLLLLKLWGVASTRNSLPDDVVALETFGSFNRAFRCCLNEKLFRFACSVKIFFVWLLLVYFIVFLFDYYFLFFLLFFSF